MAIKPNGAVCRQILTLFNVGVIGDLTDAQLLERFTTLDREAAELAFAAIVERHGPMVLWVCRNFLNNSSDAEDAFQATLLVLVQKARSLWVKDSLAPWLYRVAHRVASRARASRNRRRDHERHAAELMPTLVYDENKTSDLFRLLHNEIDRLAERYRAAVVLCDLEGLSHERAARQLGWPVGTVKSRLARARQLLRARLTGRGLDSPTILVITQAATRPVDTAVSPQLIESALEAALLVTKAPTIAVISKRAATLAEEVLKMMFLTKLKLSAATLLMACVLAASTASVLGRQGDALDPRSAPDRPSARSSDIPRPAVASATAKAPAFIRQSRGMIITRLEQELAVAENRLERTLRRVVSPNDPAAVQGRKTVDEIESLLARIDDVLVDAVDRFPTMFDFSGGQGESGSASASPNSGTLFRANVNDVYQSSAAKYGDGQLVMPNDQAANQNGSQANRMYIDGTKGQSNEPSVGKAGDAQKNNQAADQNGAQANDKNKDGSNGQSNDQAGGKAGDVQKNGQPANQNGAQSNDKNKDGAEGQGNAPSSTRENGDTPDGRRNRQVTDGEGQQATNRENKSGGVPQPSRERDNNSVERTQRDPRNQVPPYARRMRSRDPRAPSSTQRPDQQPAQDQSAQPQNQATANLQNPTQSQQQNPNQSQQQKLSTNQQQNPTQSQQQKPSTNQQQNPTQRQQQEPSTNQQQNPAQSQERQAAQQRRSRNNQQRQEQNQQQPDGNKSDTPHEQSSNPGSVAKKSSAQPPQSQQASQPKQSQSGHSQSQSQGSSSSSSESQGKSRSQGSSSSSSGSQGSSASGSGSQGSRSER